MFGSKIGETFYFRVTANAVGGTGWGTDVYTLNSPLAAAAVHAGVPAWAEPPWFVLRSSPGRTATRARPATASPATPFASSRPVIELPYPRSKRKGVKWSVNQIDFRNLMRAARPASDILRIALFAGPASPPCIGSLCPLADGQ